MLIVTGGAGFIGSNLVKRLNALGRQDILVVDNLTNGAKFRNLATCQIADYQDKEAFLEAIITKTIAPQKIEAIFHQGACSNTTEWDGRYMLRNNYEYSKVLVHYALQAQIPFIYASSASVYGAKSTFVEAPINEHPLNVYAYSKLLFDQYVRRLLPTAKSQIVGFRYFNVYGPNEQHKGKMASIIWHLINQIRETGVAKLFEGTDGFGDGEQRRDFVYVNDVVDANIWAWQNNMQSDIYNLGSGSSETFNAVANNIIECLQRGKIEYIKFPESLRNSYQSFTEADLTNLRKAGYQRPFTTLADGIKDYLKA